MAGASSLPKSTSSPFSESVTEELYDVFVCFTGKTRGGFTSHLVKQLKQAGVRTFTDELLPRGEAISDALIGRIQRSRSTIVVVSKDFAASDWCLDEVVESFRCKEVKVMQGHCIFPIFYKVEPSELRHLRGRTSHYLAQHEERYGANSDRVAWWRTCLVLLSNIAGWHFTSGGNESELIENIVEAVVTTLRMKNTTFMFSGCCFILSYEGSEANLLISESEKEVELHTGFEFESNEFAKQKEVVGAAETFNMQIMLLLCAPGISMTEP